MNAPASGSPAVLTFPRCIHDICAHIIYLYIRSQVCVCFQRVARDLEQKTSFVQGATTSATSALGTPECPAFFRINQNSTQINTCWRLLHMHKCSSLTALIGFFTLFCKHFEGYFSLQFKTCQRAELQVVLRLHVTAQVLEHPPATREYVGLTGFCIRGSKAIRGRNQACEPAG